MLQQVVRKGRGQINKIAKGADNQLNRKRHTKAITRKLIQLRHGRKARRPLIIRRGRANSLILDTLYPDRLKRGTWLPSWKRKRKHTISLKNFSFFDAPELTIRKLREIAEAESDVVDLRINFEDPHCLDIGPYLVLGMIRQDMLPVCRGGVITPALRKVIETVHLNEFLRMAHVDLLDRHDVWPFPLRFGSTVANVSTWSPTQEEKHDQAFANALNQWLKELGFIFSERGEGWVLTLIGEILDNARRHSRPDTEDGIWAMAGFMARRQREEDPTLDRYICHVGILSPGATIYESLQHADEIVA